MTYVSRRFGILALVCGISAALLFAGGCATTQTTKKPDAAALEAEAKRKAEEEAKRKAEEEARRKAAEEEAKRKAEAEAKRKAEEEARRLAEEKIRQERTFTPAYFDYDKYNIRDDQKAVLSTHVDRLKAKAEFKVELQGHCDERGTIEYNLALGQKRADSVKNFLVKAGIGKDRLTTVSYGKERPVDMGHDEAGWAKNRRVEFVVAP